MPSATQARLTITGGPEPVREVLLGAQTVIGRDPTCDIKLNVDEQVSRRHARVLAENGGFVIEDTQSRNGVLLNGTRINRAPLADGDEVTIGQTLMRFAGPSGAAKAAPELKATGTIIASLDVMEALKGAGQSAGDSVEDLKRSHANMQVVFDVHKHLAGNFELDAVLESLLDQVFRVMKPDRGVVMLIEDESEQPPRPTGQGATAMAPGPVQPRPPVIKAQRSKDPSRGGKFVVSQSILGYVLENRKAVLLNDMMDDPRFQKGQSLMIQNIQAAACAPMITKDRIVGVLQVESHHGQAFYKHDLELLTLVSGIAAVAIDNARLVTHAKNEQIKRSNLQRYLAPQVASEVLSGHIDMKLGGHSQAITVMFADVRGFTRMSEEQPAATIVATLNSYFERMVNHIFRQGGTLDKFIGDAIMAMWGAPVPAAGDAIRSVLAAIAMQQELFAFNVERRIAGHRPLFMGAGLNSGDATVGNIGTSAIMQFTAMGSTVNQASRIQGKSAAGQVLLSKSTLAAVGPMVVAHELPAVELKGIEGKVPIWAVIGLTDDPLTAKLSGLLDFPAVLIPARLVHSSTGAEFVGAAFDIGSRFGVILPAGAASNLLSGDRVTLEVVHTTLPPPDRRTSKVPHLGASGPVVERTSRVTWPLEVEGVFPGSDGPTPTSRVCLRPLPSSSPDGLPAVFDVSDDATVGTGFTLPKL